MKETINANIGGRAFTLDTDAYSRLSEYLTDVRSRVADPTDEVMNDIESGFAEIFYQTLSSPMMVVTLQMVEAAINRMGAPEEFGPQRNNTNNTNTESAKPNIKQLRRSRKDRSIAGICGGIAEYFDFESSMVRLVMLLLFIFGGLSLWVYIILWLIIPEQEE